MSDRRGSTRVEKSSSATTRHRRSRQGSRSSKTPSSHHKRRRLRRPSIRRQGRSAWACQCQGCPQSGLSGRGPPVTSKPLGDEDSEGRAKTPQTQTQQRREDRTHRDRGDRRGLAIIEGAHHRDCQIAARPLLAGRRAKKTTRDAKRLSGKQTKDTMKTPWDACKTETSGTRKPESTPIFLPHPPFHPPPLPSWESQQRASQIPHHQLTSG